MKMSHTHTHTEEYYSAIQRNEILPFAATRMDWEGFPGGAAVKSLPTNAGEAGDAGSNPRWGRSPGKGNGSSLQYSCLENSMDKGAWWATVHEDAKSQT